MQPLNRAVQIVGSQAALARMIGKSQGHIAVWKSRGRVPAEVVIPIEIATAGKVTREELRPDLYPPKSKRAA